MKSFILFLLVFSLKVGFSQLDSIHWIPPLYTAEHKGTQFRDVFDHYVYLSTPSPTPFVVTITDGGGNVLATPTISQGNPFTYFVGNGTPSKMFLRINELNTVHNDRGLLLKGDRKFYANFRAQSLNQSGALTAKGRGAKGTNFRVGVMPVLLQKEKNSNVISVMATENNTTVTIDDFDPMVFNGVPNIFNPTSFVFTLNAGETYTVSGDLLYIQGGVALIGAHVTSDKPIVMNNGNLTGSIHAYATLNDQKKSDYGFDQSVPIELLGDEYISIRGNGLNGMEQVLVVAHQNNTQILVNGGPVLTTLNAGEWYLIPESYYNGAGHENMYVNSNNTFYCYQVLGGAPDKPTYGMSLLAPLSCDLPYKIDAIPDVDKIGVSSYSGGVMVITRSDAVLTTNGTVQGGSNTVLGAPDWKTYKLEGLVGDQIIESTDNMAVAIFGASGLAGWSGYYTGFDVREPQEMNVLTEDSCGLVTLEVSPIFDTYEWFYNGNPIAGTLNTIDVFESGTYSVAMTSIYGCVDTARNLDVVIYKNPDVDFIISDTCLGDISSLVNTSTIDNTNGDLISSWNWTFGNGNVSTIQSPDLIYTNVGDYTIKLLATSNQGCKDSLEIITSIKSVPEASFTVMDSCEYLDVVYTDESSITLPEIIDTWSWDVENNGSEDYSIQSPIHDFSAGNYTTKLTVRSFFGCTDDTIINIKVYSEPVAGFLSDSICLGDVLTFTDTSSVLLPENINSYEWSFGETAMPLIQSTDQNPSFEYFSAGNFTVRQRVLTANGCESSTSQVVAVYPKPIALFNYDDNCVNQEANFIDASTVAPGVLTNWEWNFGDTPLNVIIQSSLQSPSYDYTSSGDYGVSLIVTTDKGCKDTVVENTTRYPSPIANFDVVSGCRNAELTFVNTSTILAPEILTSYVWDFGGNSSLSTDEDGVHSFVDDGFYSVTLIATSNNGCVGDTTLSVEVYPLPVASFMTTTICENEPPTAFSNLTYIPTGSISFYEWNFSDNGPVSNLPSPLYNYANSGIYDVRLIVESNYGCRDTIVNPVVVKAKPEANFISNVTSGCSPLCVELQDNSIANSNSIISYEWAVGNKQFYSEAPTACIENLSNLDESNEDIKLIITNDLGCQDTLLASDY